MTDSLNLGALHKTLKTYTHPSLASKKEKYICPDCTKDVILCQGNKNKAHFRHFAENFSCGHFSHPTESQIHKDAKLLLKQLLERKVEITLKRRCKVCHLYEESIIPELSESSSIELEYGFEFNGRKVADVAYVDEDFLCIFEICFSHKTEDEDRPEPWFEIEAVSFLQLANNLTPETTKLTIPCMRKRQTCDDCLNKKKLKVERKERAKEILFNWLKDGKQIYPFNDFIDDFYSIKMDSINDDTDESFDIIVNVGHVDFAWERYCINLVEAKEYCVIIDSNKDTYSELWCAVYFVDLNWILEQTEKPKQVKYFVSFDRYFDKALKCCKCKHFYNVWVTDYGYFSWGERDMRNIGCPDCGHNKNENKLCCQRCFNFCSLNRANQLTDMITQKEKNICIQCNGETKNRIYLDRVSLKPLNCKKDLYYNLYYVENETITNNTKFKARPLVGKPYETARIS